MLSVLIVEDNADYRGSLHHLLEERFPEMEIGEAVDGEDGLRQALALCPGLVFMDIRLPRGNGLELTKVIKSALPDTVVGVISSYDILEYREAAFVNGADFFMAKGDWTGAQIVGLVSALVYAV